MEVFCFFYRLTEPVQLEGKALRAGTHPLPYLQLGSRVQASSLCWQVLVLSGLLEGVGGTLGFVGFFLWVNPERTQF